MNLTTTQKMTRFSTRLFRGLRERPDGVSLAIIVAALIAFEVFSFSTIDFALRGIFGSQGAGALNWSTILALAFCGMDFAGITRLLSARADDNGRDGWFLLGAWVLAAAMNTALTWWGVSIAVFNQPAGTALILDPMTFVTAVPVIVAVMVWVIRVLIIGMLISTLNKGQAASRTGKPAQAPANNAPFGFKPAGQPAPAGFRPVPNPARSQSDFRAQ